MSERCPTCGADQAQHSASNSTHVTKLSVPEHLLPALKAALNTGAARAIMCGAPELQVALSDLCDKISPDIQPQAGSFDPDEWFALWHRVKSGKCVSATIANEGRSYSPSYRIVVADESGEKWPGFRPDEPLKSKAFDCREAAESVLKQINDDIERLSPLGVQLT
jgi:hypothetical protein